MAVYKRGETWWYEFVYVGQRIRESAKTTRKTIAVEAEKARRLELERNLAGLPTRDTRGDRLRSVGEYLKTYLKNYPDTHRPKSAAWVQERSKHLARLLASTLLPDLTEDKVRDYIRTRKAEQASGRTINMEVAILSRALGKPRSILWPGLRSLEERKDVGRALSQDEVQALLDAAEINRSPFIGPFLRIALLSGMRTGEILTLTWRQVDSPSGSLL